VDFWEYAAEGRSWVLGPNFVFGWQRYDEILIVFCGLRFGRTMNLTSIIFKDSVRTAQ
jgi:hypothetical protein